MSYFLAEQVKTISLRIAFVGVQVVFLFVHKESEDSLQTLVDITPLICFVHSIIFFEQMDDIYIFSVLYSWK